MRAKSGTDDSGVAVGTGDSSPDDSNTRVVADASGAIDESNSFSEIPTGRHLGVHSSHLKQRRLWLLSLLPPLVAQKHGLCVQSDSLSTLSSLMDLLLLLDGFSSLGLLFS